MGEVTSDHQLKSFPDAQKCVEQTEQFCAITPAVVVLALVGLGVTPSLVELKLVSAIVGGVFMLVVAGLVLVAVEKVVLNPYRALRYKRVANALASAAQTLPVPVSQSISWSAPVPGALSITQRGDVVLVDRATGYQQLWLNPSNLVAVNVEREAKLITNTKHSGRLSVGGASGGLLGGYLLGGRSRSTTHTIETAFLEIHFQLERNGVTQTAVIPFGDDRRAADALCATLRRLDQAA